MRRIEDEESFSHNMEKSLKQKVVGTELDIARIIELDSAREKIIDELKQSIESGPPLDPSCESKILESVEQSMDTRFESLKALIYKGLIKPCIEYGLAIWGHKRTKKIETTHKKIIRTLNCKPKHAHTDPLLKKLNILKLTDLYKQKTCTMLHKIYKENVPEIIKNYCTWNTENSRRWYHIKKENSNKRIIKQLPKFHQVNAWNETITEHNSEMINVHSTKTFGRNLKKQIIAGYETTCEISGCYSCNEEKEKERIKAEKRQKELEEKREQARREEEKAQQYWREYFNMTKSQAELYHQEKNNQIDQEYAKLMKTRGLMKGDGPNGMD